MSFVPQSVESNTCEYHSMVMRPEVNSDIRRPADSHLMVMERRVVSDLHCICMQTGFLHLSAIGFVV